ncbi:hypothetical protein HBB16_00185 [Pseudonocardia sp. MCCB 268]|nr:hypothetical protein [Pseudonocardia cytotoxica]
MISESPTARRWVGELLEEHGGHRLPNVVPPSPRVPGPSGPTPRPAATR